LRKEPFSGTGAAIIFGGEEGVETPAGGSQVGPIAGNDAGGNNLATIQPLEGGGAVLAKLARAVEYDLATPDHAPATDPSAARSAVVGPLEGRAQPSLHKGAVRVHDWRRPESRFEHRIRARSSGRRNYDQWNVTTAPRGSENRKEPLR